MNDEQQQAYDWAKNQNYQSVAARYARTLTTAVDDLQSRLADSQRRELAAVALIKEVEEIINAGAEWFDAGAVEWGDAMERYRGEPGDEHRFEMSMHIRDAYRIGIEKFDLAGAKIDRWRGPQDGKGAVK